jgi:hypothetical protein
MRRLRTNWNHGRLSGVQQMFDTFEGEPYRRIYWRGGIRLPIVVTWNKRTDRGLGW